MQLQPGAHRTRCFGYVHGTLLSALRHPTERRQGTMEPLIQEWSKRLTWGTETGNQFPPFSAVHCQPLLDLLIALSPCYHPFLPP